MGSRQKKYRLRWLEVIHSSLRILGRVSPYMAGRCADYLWYRTLKRRRSAEELAILDKATIFAQRYNGKSVQVYIWGQGPTILLVHGWNGCSGQMVFVVKALLSQGYRVISIDVPGHGRSSGHRTDLLEVSGAIKQLANDIVDISAIVAHSFGCMCVLHAVAGGLDVNSLVCVSPPRDVEMLVSKFAEMMELDSEVVKVQRRMLERRFGEHVWRKFSMLEWVRSADIPALIVHDFGDRVVPVHSSIEIHKAWAGSKLLITKGLGHNRILKDEQVIRKVTRFIGGLYV